MSIIEQARTLILSALDSYGIDALDSANKARALVGIDGIEEIATDFANENKMTEAYQVRGALDALHGEPSKGDFAYGDEYREGYRFVESGRYFAAWSYAPEQPAPALDKSTRARLDAFERDEAPAPALNSPEGHDAILAGVRALPDDRRPKGISEAPAPDGIIALVASVRHHTNELSELADTLAETFGLDTSEQSAPVELVAELLEAYRDKARDEGVDPDEIPGFASACLDAWRAGIVPSEVPNAVEDGRIAFDPDGTLRIIQ